MQFFFNLNTGAVTLALGDSLHVAGPHTLKRGRVKTRVQFHRDGTPERLEVGAEVVLVIKSAGKYEEDPGLAIAAGVAWTRPDEEEGFYTATLNTDTTQVRTELHVDGDAENDLAALEDCLGEILYLPSGGDPETDYVPSETLNFTITNKVFQGTEGEPEDADPGYGAELAALKQRSLQLLPLVTGYTGGGATKLDGVETAGLAVPTVRLFKHATEGGRIYLLRAGTDAEASPGIIRPDDYAPSTNERVWESVL